MSGRVATSLTTSFPSASDTLQDKVQPKLGGVSDPSAGAPSPQEIPQHPGGAPLNTHWYNLRAALSAGSTTVSGTAAFNSLRLPSTWFMTSISCGDSFSFSPSTTAM